MALVDSPSKATQCFITAVSHEFLLTCATCVSITFQRSLLGFLLQSGPSLICCCRYFYVLLDHERHKLCESIHTYCVGINILKNYLLKLFYNIIIISENEPFLNLG